MSWQDSKWATAQRAGSAVNKAVLLILAEASKDGVSTLSQNTIASRSEASPRAVFSALRSLESSGLIARERRVNGSGHRTSDRIKLNADLVAPAATRANDNDPTPLAPPAVRASEPTRTSDGSYSHRVPVLLARGATEPVLEPVSEPEDLQSRSAVASGEARRPHDTEAFREWWPHYPNRVKRQDAEKAFAKAIRSGDVTLEELIRSAATYGESDKVKRGFAMNPTTWLNGGCWADEPLTVASQTGSALDYALRSIG